MSRLNFSCEIKSAESTGNMVSAIDDRLNREIDQGRPREKENKHALKGGEKDISVSKEKEKRRRKVLRKGIRYLNK